MMICSPCRTMHERSKIGCEEEGVSFIFQNDVGIRNFEKVNGMAQTLKVEGYNVAGGAHSPTWDPFRADEE